MAESVAPAPSSRGHGSSAGFTAVPYDETTSSVPPVPVARPVSSRQRVDEGKQKERDELSRPATATPTKTSQPLDKGKESGPRPSTSSRSRPNLTFGRRRTPASTDNQSAPSLESSAGVPSIVVDEVRPSSRRSERMWNGLRGRKSEDKSSSIPAVPPLPPVEPFQGITLDIPTASFDDFTTQLNKKPSVKGAKPNGVHANNSSNSLAAPTPQKSGTKRVRSSNSLAPRPSSSASRAISVDEDILSQKVRLMYEKGDEGISDAELNRLVDPSNEVLWEELSSVADDATEHSATPNNGSMADLRQSSFIDPPHALSSRRGSVILREQHELAGGIEDWENVQVEDVDRYGFIIPKRDPGDPESNTPQPMQRVSTSLLLAADTPRRKRTLRGGQSSGASIRSFSGRPLSRKSTEQSNRPSTSQSSYQSSLTRTNSRLRSATNRLPHKKDRRLRDEAADMLTLPTQLGNVPEEDTPYARALKKKEWEREDKWRKMAKLTSKHPNGGGMTFEFDIKSPKVIGRTWKGIPDRWRATAWHAFLSASAKQSKGSPTDEEIVRRFNELQDESSPDDVQIDIDVPRTISHHIMFRRRYRGGQRLLFRVLHAMSLYFPETGYVQGMATLAATLLAYYDEENAFVMLVRLWQLRGLDRLYRSGFAGLMEALDNFEKEWLDGGEVAEKLSELGIPPTAYGTRWYLTLFNYSIPFAAQLRVWDVFMLLGDCGEVSPSSSRPATGCQAAATPFGKSFDVLHATSAALIDGMRDILLESDFENGMKVLTSWVPIKDVELFMRVARAEWKVHLRKKNP